MAYVKPIKPAVVLSYRKAEKFLSQVPDQESRKREKELLERFRKNNTKK